MNAKILYDDRDPPKHRFSYLWPEFSRRMNNAGYAGDIEWKKVLYWLAMQPDGEVDDR